MNPSSNENSPLILFQGDSITDCGRDRNWEKDVNHSDALGCGYAAMVAAEVLAQYPAKRYRFLNRGISGNRVVDLYARWKVDGINLKPDLISILIGVNDSWHEFPNRNGVEVDRYEAIYRMLLQFTKATLPNVGLILCEPFAFPCGAVTPEISEDLVPRREVVRRLAAEFGAVHVPFQEMFDAALKEAPAEYWAPDGVHPSPAGHARMAQFWRSRVGL